MTGENICDKCSILTQLGCGLKASAQSGELQRSLFEQHKSIISIKDQILAWITQIQHIFLITFNPMNSDISQHLLSIWEKPKYDLSKYFNFSPFMYVILRFLFWNKEIINWAKPPMLFLISPCGILRIFVPTTAQDTTIRDELSSVTFILWLFKLVYCLEYKIYITFN